MNIGDVAKAAGVSISTVSRVLSKADYPMRAETRMRVLEAIEALDFRPNDLARGLVRKNTRMIGLVIPDISNPYYPELCRGVEDVASSEAYTVLFCNTDRLTEKSRLYIDALIQKRVDGIIIAGGGTEYALSPEMFAPFHTKVVLVGRHSLPFPSVQVDNVKAAREATAHLAGLGHARIGFITGPANLTSVTDRMSGYRQGLEAHGITYDDRLVRVADFEEVGGYAAAQSLLLEVSPPTAIFAANDRMAVGVMAAARDLGIDVPDDLALIGFDNISMASLLRPALTTVALPSRQMGMAAMQLLLKQLTDKPAPQTVWLSTRLVVRASCGTDRGLGAERTETSQTTGR